MAPTWKHCNLPDGKMSWTTARHLTHPNSPPSPNVALTATDSWSPPNSSPNLAKAAPIWRTAPSGLLSWDECMVSQPERALTNSAGGLTPTSPGGVPVPASQSGISLLQEWSSQSGTWTGRPWQPFLEWMEFYKKSTTYKYMGDFLQQGGGEMEVGGGAED